MRNPTHEEIISKLPEVIPSSSIPLKNKGGRPKRHGHDKHKWYSEDDRIRAATTYAMVGNAARVAEITGIPSERVRRWKTEPWWHDVINRIRFENDDELDAKFTRIIDKTTEIINDRLENGDYIMVPKTGEIIKKPVGAKESAIITSIMVDKRTLLRDKATKVYESDTVMDNLKKLADEFQKFYKAKDVTKESLTKEDNGNNPSK